VKFLKRKILITSPEDINITNPVQISSIAQHVDNVAVSRNTVSQLKTLLADDDDVDVDDRLPDVISNFSMSPEEDSDDSPAVVTSAI
jgi:hypothetical protein